MTLEAWVRTATPGEKPDLTEPPSEAFDCGEVVVTRPDDWTSCTKHDLPVSSDAATPSPPAGNTLKP